MTDPHAALLEALETFRPRWKSLDDDALNLASHAKRIAAKGPGDGDVSGLPALWAGRGPAFERLVTLYFQNGRADLIEAHYKIDEWGAGLPHRIMRKRFHQFATLGHGASAVRCWQHYIRKNAAMFWQDVRDVSAVEKRLRKDPGLQGEYDHNSLSLARTRRLTLEAIALARRPFDAFGTERQREWLDRTRQEILSGERTRVAAKPLPDDMDDALFWRLLAEGGETTAERLDTLPDRLAAYSAKAIKAFGQMATDHAAAAYREDIWALAYLVMDGCSDDAFDYFRDWLLLQGHATHAAVLADPDAFDPATLGETPLAEGLMDAIDQAHVMRAGKDLPKLKQPKLKRLDPDEDAFATLLPNVAARTA